MHRIAFALLLVACAPATGGQTNTPANTNTAPGANASDFTLRDTDGKDVHLSDYLGQKVILIDFWATWCVPCIAELPLLDNIYQARKDKFVVLAVSMDGPETLADVQTFVRRYNLNFPVLLDAETRVTNLYNQKRTAPLSVLIDKNGRIIKVREGFNSGDEKLVEAEVDKALAN
jgi:peroxiredoxin